MKLGDQVDGSSFLSAWEARRMGSPELTCSRVALEGGSEGMPTDSGRQTEIRNCVTRNRMTG